jgi:hypothetical protein
MRNATPEKKLSQDRIKTNLISRIKNHYVARTRCSRSVTSLPPSSVGQLLVLDLLVAHMVIVTSSGDIFISPRRY